MADRVIEELSEDECLELIRPGGIGRIAYVGRFGPAVLPVNYKVQDGAILFRTAENGPLDEDLRTGIADADYKVAFEIDDIDNAARRGWSVLVQGRRTTSPGPAKTRSAPPAWSPGRRATGSCSSGSSRPASRAAVSVPLEAKRKKKRNGCR